MLPNASSRHDVGRTSCQLISPLTTGIRILLAMEKVQQKYGELRLITDYALKSRVFLLGQKPIKMSCQKGGPYGATKSKFALIMLSKSTG